MYTLHQHTTTPLHCRYANFVSSIWGNEITGMTPSELKREIGELAPQFAGYVNPVILILYLYIHPLYTTHTCTTI